MLIQNNYLRKCRHCGLEAHTQADMNGFAGCKKSLYGKQNVCNKCASNYYHVMKSRNVEKILLNRRDRYFQRKYGMTIEQRAAYIEEVGKCEICSKEVTPETAHIDHSHNASKNHVRGVLCNNCNTGLGKFKDSVDMMNKAIKYLIEREHKLESQAFGIENILDAAYHDRINSTDTWMEAIQAVKNKYPKS